MRPHLRKTNADHARPGAFSGLKEAVMKSAPEMGQPRQAARYGSLTEIMVKESRSIRERRVG